MASSGGERKLTLSRETLRDLEPSRALTDAVRGGTGPSGLLCDVGTGGPVPGTTRLPTDACGGGGTGIPASAICKGSVKITDEEIVFDLKPNEEFKGWMTKLLEIKKIEAENS